ncbi:SDR family oxidoreductase [Streptomyces cocklensis]|jgi:NAD(P)-dependent dehydrogenase (short-subunit alcohol dehydrogenase family)|uniref:NAD(P)-dependent dehydrogenase, short-chain alcohol dehydrogenase family n=1 Tax=Actinacidiphila cocklensis TaxID=887465 RepID=A0A9W4GV13_9ACTN|nr:SDR family oxidoreductase [Actinacidiphila cocklensis]MDD1061787.1 SDR family oxidoreductase [Actinacidiphila cocklensis]WSX76032.1 SDR family oxidoreductase [Streptomyces sp. NBC_00899]CAG6396247.1 NAD(P)-dependent dehydrogenase, short-chain alcohol dehydrogenase family [Actinacidiphila cocklensis]
MSDRFTGKAVLVTGGGSGIGRAVALAFAREGARVAVAGRSPAPLDETVALVEAEGGKAAAIGADITRGPDAERMVAQAVARLGALDVAVNGVGILVAPGPVGDMAEDDWRHTVDTNLTGLWLSMKYEIAHMRGHGGGSIVNIASNIGAHRRAAGLGAYAATKAAVSALTRNAALDHIADGVRINAVSPGPVDTPMSSRPGETPAAKAARMRAQLPLGRASSTAEVAAAVLHLASAEAGSTVGTDLVIDSGATA